MLYVHWIIVIIIALFCFLFALLLPNEEEISCIKFNKRLIVGFGALIIVLFAFMPVPQFIQSKTAVQGYVAKKSNEDPMSYLNFAIAKACQDNIVMGYEFMDIKSKFHDDIDRIVDEKSVFSMSASFASSAPLELTSAKRPICELAKK